MENLMYFLVLAKYEKSNKTTWWLSTTEWLWKKGQHTLISGTTTGVFILDVVNIDAETYNNLKD